MLVTSFILAIREIRRHALRSFLTVLGIVIGVASVITMVTLAKGAAVQVKRQISSLGANILQIRPVFETAKGEGPAPAFKAGDLEAIREQIGGVVAVAGQTRLQGVAVRDGRNRSTTINGTSNDYFVAMNWALRGRSFSAEEEQAGKSVCIIGATVEKHLFPGVDPLGLGLRIKNVACEVIGVLSSRGRSFGMDQDDVVVMPIKSVQRRFLGDPSVSEIVVLVDPAYDGDGVRRLLTTLLRERRHPGAEDDFDVGDNKTISDALAGSTRVLTVLLGGVAAISLLVGGIGIMNVMLVSVTERTREIGTRLAIGALRHEVQLQFLVEAAVLASLGGLIGIVLAFVVGIGLLPALDIPFIFGPQINLLSFAVSAVIGVVFGYFPARRAAALNPIEALRHE